MAAPDHLGDYDIVEEIGRGGFGVVYRARQVSLDRPVALKVLYEHKVHTAEELARFEREARAAARLDHPAVVSVHAWGEDKGSFYIAQKLVGHGRTLADDLAELKERGEHPKGYFRKIAETLAIVADALQHAADNGIVHRDVKPSNVLLDDKGQPFLGDFGLAKLEDGLELSRTGDFAGSPYYMSPEQADAKRGEVDHRADIYCLGVTLYEMLTLSPPFMGQSAHEIIRKILSEEPKRPTKVNDRVPTDLETICLKAMEKGRSRRYQNASEVADDLRAFLEGEPISASPVGAMSRAFRKARRNRAGVGMVVLVVALLGMAKVAQLSAEGKKEAEEGKKVAEREAETSRESVAMVDELRKETSDILGDAMKTALKEEDASRMGEISDFRTSFDQWVSEGQAYLLDVVPDVADNSIVQGIGESLQDQSMYDSIKQAAEYLASHSDEEKADPRLVGIAEWLKETSIITKTAEALNLPVRSIFGTDQQAAAAGSTVGAAKARGLSGPPTGPGGALSGSSRPSAASRSDDPSPQDGGDVGT
ncbi:MAG: hypothetical protein ACI9EF_001014 [Pseudohongiellaceae bacterium]|jgi:hypothetical protein